MVFCCKKSSELMWKNNFYCSTPLWWYFLSRLWFEIKNRTGVILTSMEPNIFRMVFSIKNKKNYDVLSLLYLWWAKKPVLSMKYWHGWLLLKMAFSAFSVITSHVNNSWREQVVWPTKGTGGLQHHNFFYFWWKTAS